MGIEKGPDRRQFGRRMVFKAAVVANSGGVRIPGHIIDISDAGARIKVADPTAVEIEFFLEIPEDDIVVKCRVMRVDETSVGVQYIRPPRRLSWIKKR
ncbi:PilZ domain-containing protein [Hyphomicrobium methylovorum]|nr:PilZ domain-containing protein [Hyphomicrobium methylovorum]